MELYLLISVEIMGSSNSVRQVIGGLHQPDRVGTITTRSYKDPVLSEGLESQDSVGSSN